MDLSVLTDPAALMGMFWDFITWWTMVIGFASMVLKAAEVYAESTASTKDDIKVAKVREILTALQNALHSLAMTPKDKIPPNSKN